MTLSDQVQSHAAGSLDAAAHDLLLLTLELSGSLDARTVVRRILERSLTLAVADRATLSSMSAGHLTVEATVGRGGEVTWAGRDFDARVLVRQAPVVELLATRRTVLAGPLTSAEAMPEFRTALADVRHTALVPILEDGETAGMLVLSRYSDSAFRESDIPNLTAFGALAGLALRNAKLYEEATSTARRLAAAADAAADVARVQHMPVLVERIIAHACEAAGADAGSVMRRDGAEIVLEATSGVAPVGTRWPLSDEMRTAIATGHVVQVGMADDDKAAPEPATYASQYSCALVTPLRFSGELLGLLVLARRHGRPPFSASDMAGLQEFATLAALVMHNSRLIQQLRDAEAMKREFMNIAVHELRGPLTVIEGYAEMLLAETDVSTQREMAQQLATIRRQAEHARSLAEDLLILARLESDELGVARQDVDISSLLAEISERAGPRAQLRGGSIDLDVDTGLHAVGDRVLVARIVDNLISNAVDYSTEAPHVVVVGCSAGAEVVIRVDDEGMGVPADENELIFARFTRGSRTGAIKGSGLGLYLSRECARRMHGELELDSAPREVGSSFRLTLPAAPRS